LEFPSVIDAFFQKLPLETMLKEVESAFIFHSLKAIQDNISHTALQLGIPRTTLQNIIKFLDLQSLYTLSRENSIPRKNAVPPHHSEEKPETHTKNPKSSASSKQVPVTSTKSGKNSSNDTVRITKKSTTTTAYCTQPAKKTKPRSKIS
ncbi:transcriptional regulator, partial [Leptospira borgpetersenii serovar Hardjo-bovis]|nr:transcriptional regulator [Leptospira borgpetersenii serovar Hardjo-bovis]